MNYDKPSRRRRGYFALMPLSALLFTTCRGEMPNVPAQDEFTKQKIEKLGELLLAPMLSDAHLLPNLPPYDTTVYFYVQTLYDQAANAMRLDRQSPPYDRWNQQRPWRVFIIQNNGLQHAWSLPGGDLFITTGMLLSFEREYELYYLLTFEAVLMHEGFQLERLIREYNSLTISNIIEGTTIASQITADSLGKVLPKLPYAPDDIEEADPLALQSVCETSVFDPKGIGPFLLNPTFDNAQWLSTRPSYSGRISILASLSGSDCGDLTTTGDYQRYVLDVLD